MEFSGTTLRASSRPTLDASIELLEVQSHTRDANLAQRAAVVVAYIVAAGVEPTRLVAEGYGDTQPIDRTTPAKNERWSRPPRRCSSSASTASCTRDTVLSTIREQLRHRRDEDGYDVT